MGSGSGKTEPGHPELGRHCQPGQGPTPFPLTHLRQASPCVKHIPSVLLFHAASPAPDFLSFLILGSWDSRSPHQTSVSSSVKQAESSPLGALTTAGRAAGLIGFVNMLGTRVGIPIVSRWLEVPPHLEVKPRSFPRVRQVVWPLPVVIHLLALLMALSGLRGMPAAVCSDGSQRASAAIYSLVTLFPYCCTRKSYECGT